jgi:hypothetical protein
MKKGKEITIIRSVALENLGLGELSGRKATVIEAKRSKSGDVKGCWVSLIGRPFDGEQEWYIPYISIVE